MSVFLRVCVVWFVLVFSFWSPVPVQAGTVDGEVKRDALDKATMCGIGRGKKCKLEAAIARGLFETGLRPKFPDGLDCRDIDEQYAIDYASKRNKRQLHGGIDMPAPFGTPIVAVAAGTVIAIYEGETSYRGREVILRHSPEDTGLPYWIFTEYAHFDEMPQLSVGERVSMGQELGPTGNSGRGKKNANVQSAHRRPAIHFAVFYSDGPEFANHKSRVVVPVGGYWMDPNALYRGKPPFDSAAMKALPDDEKQIAIPVLLEDGTTVPADTRLVWPYTCTRP